LKEEARKFLDLEYSLVWVWNLVTPESRSEKSGNFRNVVLREGGGDQLDRSFEKWRITKSQAGEEYRTYSKV